MSIPWSTPVPLAPDASPMSKETAQKVGFRELSDAEQALILCVRSQGAELDEVLKNISDIGADPRWVAIARTHFQEGCMAAVRAITKPAFF